LQNKSFERTVNSNSGSHFLIGRMLNGDQMLDAEPPEDDLSEEELQFPLQDTEEDTSCSVASTAFRQDVSAAVVAANGFSNGHVHDKEVECDCDDGDDGCTLSNSTCSGCSRSCSCTTDEEHETDRQAS
jgi:hypothetical protein